MGSSRPGCWRLCTRCHEAYPNGTYAVDANNNYVPASRMESLWTDYLTRQEQPDIATAREVELAQQHRANERFNNQLDNAAFGLMTTPLLVPALANPLTTLAGIGGGLLFQNTENKLIANLSDGKYHNWNEFVDSWDGIMGNSNDAENLYTNVFDPGMLIGGALAGYAASPYEKPIPDVYRAVKTCLIRNLE